MPCNGTREKLIMGNLKSQSWEELWSSSEAEQVRQKVRHCQRKCWMIGSVSPAMHKYLWIPGWWVLKHKFLSFGKAYSMYEIPAVRDHRDGLISKDALDLLSTCEFQTEVNDHERTLGFGHRSDL